MPVKWHGNYTPRTSDRLIAETQKAVDSGDLNGIHKYLRMDEMSPEQVRFWNQLAFHTRIAIRNCNVY